MPEKPSRTAKPWVIVAGGFHHRGGMDKANLALAEFLAAEGIAVHLVSHSVDPVLATHPRIKVHPVNLPGGAVAVGQWLLDRKGRECAGGLPEARVVVNGGNCLWPGINWVHSVHHAWDATFAGTPLWFQVKSAAAKWIDRLLEKRAFGAARVIVANSETTKNHLVRLCGVDPAKIRTVYLGSDPEWGPVDPDEHEQARRELAVPAGRKVAVFVGALGYDNHKGFDLLFDAWKQLCADPAWDVDLLAAGSGRALPMWQRRVASNGLEVRLRLLGFHSNIRQLLAAADVLVSPVRYEAYGLNVQEAICRGVPAIVSARAGIAERYPEELQPLLLPDPEDIATLVLTLRRWREDIERWRRRSQPLGVLLRRHTWRDMARQIYQTGEQAFSA